MGGRFDERPPGGQHGEMDDEDDEAEEEIDSEDDDHKQKELMKRVTLRTPSVGVDWREIVCKRYGEPPSILCWLFVPMHRWV